MTTTINTTFDPDTLPDWARRIPEVVSRCRTDLAFRCDVFIARTDSSRNLLINEALSRSAK